jgi:putative ABC transport system ATP-binding protein
MDSDHVTPPSNHPFSESVSRDAETLLGLADSLGLLVNSTFAQRASKQAADQSFEDPLERLESAAEVVGIRLNIYRQALGEALWMARDDQPLVIWQADPGCWVLINRCGFFRVHLTVPTLGHKSAVITRGELVKRLGLKNLNDSIDLAVASPERHAEGVRGHGEQQKPALLPVYHLRDGSGDHGHGHDHHVSPIKRFLGLLKPEMRDVWTLLVFSLITGLLYLAAPLAVSALVSNLAFGTQSAPFQQALLVIAIALFGFLLLSGVIRGLQYYVAEVIQRRMFVRLAADMAYRLPRVKAASLDGIHAPEMVNRFLDVVTVQKGTSLLLLDGFNVILGSGVGLIVLGFYHPFLLAFTAGLIIALTFIVFGLGRGAISTSIQESICKYDMVNWLEELARYPRLFKGRGGYEMATLRADELSRAFLRARSSHFRILFSQISGLILLEVIASSALLMVGGWLVLQSQLTLGQLVASELIVSSIVVSLSKLAKKFEAWYDMLAAVDKLGHLVDLEIETEEGDFCAVTTGGLEVVANKVSFAYPDCRGILDDVSFTVPAGGRAALTGSQGSGCSTLLDLLLALRFPSSGHIAINGLDVRSWYLEQLRKHVMLVRSQDIVNGSIAENIRLGRPEVSLDTVQRVLKLVGLADDLLTFPAGIHTQLLTGGLTLSSRQRTRLLLARALALQPKLLLLDDIFDGMDTHSMIELTDVIMSPDLPWTVIISTRDPLLASKCGLQISLDQPLFPSAL